MKLNALIENADALIPNAYTGGQKTDWVNELAARIQTEVWLRGAWDAVKYTWPDDGETELLPLSPAFESLWISWLRAKIEFSNGEFERYANNEAVFNSLISAYTRWFTETYAPAYRKGYLLLGEIDFSSTSGSAVTLTTLKPGTIVLGVICKVTEAFNSGTSDTLTLGTSEGLLIKAADINARKIDSYSSAPTVVTTGFTPVQATRTGAGTAASKGRAEFYARLLFEERG